MKIGIFDFNLRLLKTNYQTVISRYRTAVILSNPKTNA